MKSEPPQPEDICTLMTSKAASIGRRIVEGGIRGRIVVKDRIGATRLPISIVSSGTEADRSHS
jgi:hypothetical protein